MQDLISIDSIRTAITNRFSEKLGGRAGILNAEVARRSYEETRTGTSTGKRVYVKAKEWLPAWNEMPMGTSLKSTTYDGVSVGPGSSFQNLTGKWRWSSPHYLKDKCIRCLRCWWSCPDSAIVRLEDNYMKWDFNYCKGCGICAEICPVSAIDMVQGMHEW